MEIGVKLSWKARVAVFFASIVGLMLLLQVVPYGKDHTNPPIVREPDWAGARTRELARRACFDCHSNETRWPQLSDIAPVSWLVYYDVKEGRRELNFSDWRGGAKKHERPDKMAKEVRTNRMPPLMYILMHPEARLTSDERQELVGGLEATGAQHRSR
jgi:hypothetical protein